MVFLQVIFFIILGFYLLGWIGRMLLRYWILKKQKEFQQNGTMGGFTFKQYNWGAGQNRSTQTEVREGEIKVERNASTEKKVSGKVGDYVDYEEIKE